MKLVVFQTRLAIIMTLKFIFSFSSTFQVLILMLINSVVGYVFVVVVFLLLFMLLRGVFVLSRTR